MLRQLNKWHFQRISNKAHINGNKEIQILKYTKVEKYQKNIINTQSKLKKSRKLICINYIGGLGNIMFLYASAYGLSRMKNMDLVINNNNDLLKVFRLGSNNLRIVPNYTLCKGFINYGETQNCALNKQLLNIKNSHSFWIIGYLQSYKYFEAFFDDLRSQFTFKTHIQKKANKILLNITTVYLQSKGSKQSKITLIGVHIRRGDMVDNKYGYTVGTVEYFRQAMNWFRSKYQKAVFVVCSNEIIWGKQNLVGRDIYFVEQEPREVDLAVLASCDHLISSVGSFSWWASWLCKGTVTYFFPPAKNGSDLRRQYSKDYSDYFLPKWIHF